MKLGKIWVSKWCSVSGDKEGSVRIPPRQAHFLHRPLQYINPQRRTSPETLKVCKAHKLLTCSPPSLQSITGALGVIQPWQRGDNKVPQRKSLTVNDLSIPFHYLNTILVRLGTYSHQRLRRGPAAMWPVWGPCPAAWRACSRWKAECKRWQRSPLRWVGPKGETAPVCCSHTAERNP